MSKDFTSQFKADFQHSAQVGAARKKAFLASKHSAPELDTNVKLSREIWEYPALTSESKEDSACIRRVRAVQQVEKFYAGILSDPNFRLTTLAKPVKGKGKGKGKGKYVTVQNGAVIPPARQTALVNA